MFHYDMLPFAISVSAIRAILFFLFFSLSTFIENTLAKSYGQAIPGLPFLDIGAKMRRPLTFFKLQTESS